MNRHNLLLLLALAVFFCDRSAVAELTDVEKAQSTIAAMRSIATSWEAFAVDHNSYLPPKIAEGLSSRGRAEGEEIRWSHYTALSYEALVKALMPTYATELPRVDGWGRPLQFAVHIQSSQGVDYMIRSLGSDGTEDREGRYQPGATAAFASDIVYGEGELLVYPAALIRKPTPTLSELNGLTPTQHVVALLEGTGLGYSKVQDDVWTVQFTGSTVQTITLTIIVSGDTLGVWCKIAAPGRLKLDLDTLRTLLYFSHDVDGVKATLADDSTIWARFDARVQSVDGSEFEYMLNQVASAADELVSKLKTSTAASRT